MEALFLRVVALSLAGSATYLVLLATEALFKRFLSWRWRYYTRLVVLLAFSVPLVLPALPNAAPYRVGGSLALPPQAPVSLIPRLVPILWMVGVAVFLLWQLLAWVRFSSVVRGSSHPAGMAEQSALALCRAELQIHRRVKLAICPRVGSPALIGLLRPVILLPRKGIPPEELALILRHELIHLRRSDILYKLAAQAVNAVHWFHPLSWALARQVNELCELACDEAAVRGLTQSQRRQYGLAIINQVEAAHTALPQSVPAFSKAKQNLIKRLDSIMKKSEMSLKHAIFASAGALILCSAGITSAVAFAPTQAASVEIVSKSPSQNSISTSPRNTVTTFEVNDDSAFLVNDDSVLIPADEALYSFTEDCEVQQLGEGSYLLTITQKDGSTALVEVSGVKGEAAK